MWHQVRSRNHSTSRSSCTHFNQGSWTRLLGESLLYFVYSVTLHTTNQRIHRPRRPTAHQTTSARFRKLPTQLNTPNRFVPELVRVFPNASDVQRLARCVPALGWSRCRRWSRSRPARLLLLCPRISWTGSSATGEQRWRSWLPLRRLQGSGRAGDANCRRSLESLIS